jgi:hypothetical protein
MEVLKNKADVDLTKCLVYDAHLIKTFRSCEEKFRLFEIEHIVGKQSKAAPAFGIAFHEGVASYRLAKRAKLSYQVALKKAQEDFLTAYKKHMPPEALSEVMTDAKRGPQNGLRLLTGYVNHYEPIGTEWLHVEVPFALYLGPVTTPVGDKDLIYVGIIDGVGQLNGRIDVNDIKTTGMFANDSWLEGFKMDQGLLGYMVAAREVLGIDTHYASIHGIWIQGEPKNPSKAKPLDEYFMTKEIYWDDDQIAEWQMNTISTVKKIERAKFEESFDKDYGQNCGAFGGCAYRGLCSVTPRFRKQMVEMDYERKIWTPLEDERLQPVDGL